MEAEDQKEERLKKSEQSLGRLWDAISRSSLWGSQKEERERGKRRFEKIVAENFLKRHEL